MRNIYHVSGKMRKNARFSTKVYGSKNKTKFYNSASTPLMTTEEQSETEKVLLKNKAVQLQVVYNNAFYKHFLTT